MKTRLVGPASQQADRIDRWWRENRPAARYYEVDESDGLVMILAVWGAPRGSGPRL